MRQIKFRAWDNILKYMLTESDYDNWLDFSGDYWTSPEKKYDTPNQEIKKRSDIILMQFTGLKDKNGKEIYEGDIVRAHDHPTEVDNALGDIYYFQGSWRIKNAMPTLPEYGTAWTEVIGNIYENPELL